MQNPLKFKFIDFSIRGYAVGSSRKTRNHLITKGKLNAKKQKKDKIKR